jgi:hypothetical protein
MPAKRAKAKKAKARRTKKPAKKAVRKLAALKPEPLLRRSLPEKRCLPEARTHKTPTFLLEVPLSEAVV